MQFLKKIGADFAYEDPMTELPLFSLSMTAAPIYAWDRAA
jgi:hypothetical protein